jgi:hypothetical protein
MRNGTVRGTGGRTVFRVAGTFSSAPNSECQVYSIRAELSGGIQYDRAPRPAQNALEFLVRQKAVHFHCVRALVGAALPFHDTRLFARVLQLAVLSREPLFAFLETAARNAAPVPCSVIVSRCAADAELLSFITDLIVSAKNSSNHAAIAFGTAVLVDLISTQARSPRVEQAFRLILARISSASSARVSGEGKSVPILPLFRCVCTSALTLTWPTSFSR